MRSTHYREMSELRRLRRFLNLSIQDVSGATGVPMGALSDADGGRRQLNNTRLSLVRGYLWARLQMAKEYSEVARVLGPFMLGEIDAEGDS